MSQPLHGILWNEQPRYPNHFWYLYAVHDLVLRIHSLHKPLFWTVHTVQPPIKGGQYKSEWHLGIANPKRIFTIILDLKDNTGQINNIILNKSTTFLERPSSSSAFKNGPGTEEKMNSEGKGPTSRWWVNTLSACVTTVNAKGPYFTILDALSQIHL